MVKVNKSDGFTTFVFSSADIRTKSEDERKEEMSEGLTGASMDMADEAVQEMLADDKAEALARIRSKNNG